MKRRILFWVLIMCMCMLAACEKKEEIKGTTANPSEKVSNQAEEGDIQTELGEVPPEEGNITIYYLDGNGITSEEQFMLLTIENVFEAWKEKHSIGEEVQYLRTYVEDVNAYTEEHLFADETYVTYYPSGNYIYHIYISNGLNAYYNIYDEQKLLESLIQTIKTWNESDSVVFVDGSRYTYEYQIHME